MNQEDMFRAVIEWAHEQVKHKGNFLLVRGKIVIDLEFPTRNGQIQWDARKEMKNKINSEETKIEPEIRFA